MDEQLASFEFRDDNTPVMKIMPDGRFFVRGKEVETDTEIRDVLVAWTKVFTLESINSRQLIVDQRDELLSALTELVDLKARKDLYGKDAEYERRMPLAWQEARAVLLRWVAPPT